MALFDLNRAGDTPISTLKVAEIVPKNWHKFPAVQSGAPPAYVPVFTYNGGVVGDDVDVAESNVLVDDRGIGDYSPRNQGEKSTALGAQNPLAVDISRARGTIASWQPYPKAGDTPVAAPVITSLSPNTIAAGAGPAIVVDIVGTGFTQWSTVLSGNYPIPSLYISPTLLRIAQFPKNSVAGTVQVVVIDHDVNSAPSNFVFT